jgi:hypothetical protein
MPTAETGGDGDVYVDLLIDYLNYKIGNFYDLMDLT